MELKRIAVLHSPFPEKFGIPRQSGLTENISEIVFESQFRDGQALRGIEEFDRLWLIWGFPESNRSRSATVRPPRLGGNRRMGVFATRSPFRPNPIGLSSVGLVGVYKKDGAGTVLRVTGADMLDGTEIYDIKPYLAYTDAYPAAAGGFAERARDYSLKVDEQGCALPEGLRDEILSVLSQDPRPAYQDDPERVYGMKYANLEIKFTVADGVLTVQSVEEDL